MFQRAVLTARLLLCALVFPPLTGCIGHRVIYPVQPTAEELQAFLAAGPVDEIPDDSGLEGMRMAGPYRVGPGDLLKFELPAEARGDATEGALRIEVRCRVQPSGMVLLPQVGDFEVAGRTPTEIEDAVAEAYHDVAMVEEYATVKVEVKGPVALPGIHELRSDHRTIGGALMAAGGIKPERGAARILVLSKDETGQTIRREVGVLSGDIPLSDIALVGGETIVVEPPGPRQFTVYGLVGKSGVFEYPVPRVYNLMQALAVAGGVDPNAAPRYATIYRKDAAGNVLGATFKIDGTALMNASNIRIKDGDVIAVEHTPGSWARLFFTQVFGLRANVTAGTATSPTL
jgi:protein involved in polysaccharide export with SLBB domain